jgi:putative FmdB family regulatory protein
MPVYEYECGKCKHRFDKRQSFHDEPVADCPICHAAARRVFQPAPIIFKGSGFYVTDYPKGSDSGASKSST